jgi:hypothetical protein
MPFARTDGSYSLDMHEMSSLSEPAGQATKSSTIYERIAEGRELSDQARGLPRFDDGVDRLQLADKRSEVFQRDHIRTI